MGGPSTLFLIFHAFDEIDGGLQNAFVVLISDGLQSFVERHPGEVGDFSILFFNRFRVGEGDEVDDFFHYAGSRGVADRFPESGAEVSVQAGFFFDFPQGCFDFRFAVPRRGLSGMPNGRRSHA
jgi:hypothetical protein